MMSTIPTLEVRNSRSLDMGAQRTQQVVGQVDQEKREAHGIGNRGLCHSHKVLQAEMLLGFPEGKLDLEPQSIIVDQRLGTKKQIAAEEDHMSYPSTLKMGFLDYYRSEITVRRLACAQVFFWHLFKVETLSRLAARLR